MCTEEALTTNAIKMVEGFENVGLEFAVKVHKFNEFPRLVTDFAVMEHYINAAADRTEDALRVFKQMSASGVEPNAYVYAFIIKALADADLKRNPNFVTFAKMYFVEMLDKGMQPNEETYEAVLGGIGRGENKTKAEEERREFEENVKGKGFMLVLQKGAEEMAKPPSLKSEMDMHKEHVMKVFEGVIRELEDDNEQKRFRQIAEDYDSLSTCAFTFYNCLLGKGLNEEAKELFKPLLETAILPDEAVFTIVILLSKTTSDALKVYEYMLAYGITPSSCTYSVLIVNLSLDPNFIGLAKKYYLEMLDNGMKPCLRTSLAVLSGIACLESLEDGEEFLERVKPKGVLPDSGAGRLIELMKGHKLFGDLQKRTTDKEIQEVIREITVEGFQKHASKMFDAMVEDGNVGEAMDLFQSTGETRINPMVIVHTTVIEAHIKFNKNEDALQTYLDMLAAGFAPNSYTYNILIKALAADANFFGDAKKCLIEMLDKGMHPNVATYTAVLEGFARQVDKKAEEEGKKFLPTFVDRLDHIMDNFADDIIDLCIEKYLEGEMYFNWNSHLAKEEVSDREPVVVSEQAENLNYIRRFRIPCATETDEVSEKAEAHKKALEDDKSSYRAGTTIIAISSRDAIYVAADTFVISTHPDSLLHIEEGKHRKIHMLNDRVVATIAGKEHIGYNLLHKIRAEMPENANIHLWREACQRSIQEWKNDNQGRPFESTIGFYSWHDGRPVMTLLGARDQLEDSFGATLLSGSGSELAWEFLRLKIYGPNWTRADYTDVMRTALTISSMHSPGTGGTFPLFRLDRGGGMQVLDRDCHSLICFDRYYPEIAALRIPDPQLNVDFSRKLLLVTRNLPYTIENEIKVRAAIRSQLRGVVSAHVMGVAKKNRFDGCLSTCDVLGKVQVVVWIVDFSSGGAADSAAESCLRISSTKSSLFKPTREKLQAVSTYFQLDSDIVR